MIREPALLPDVALLGAENARTRAYLDLLWRAGLEPAHCLLMTATGPVASARRESTELFENTLGAAEAAARAGSPVTVVEAEDVNAPTVVRAVASLEQSVVIFSGPGGAIVREPLFATGKRFLHVHPGRLPDFRGSTTVYYGLLAENEIAATALFLEPRIDAGPMLGRAVYPPPADRTTLDVAYDPWLRADLLVRVLKAYAETGRFEETPQAGQGETFYIVHPVLKHIAILAA